MDAHSILVETRNRVSKEWEQRGSDVCMVAHMAHISGEAPYGDAIEFIYSSDKELEELKANPEAIEARALLAAILGIQSHLLYMWQDQVTKERVLGLLDKAIAESAPAPNVDFLAVVA